MQSSTEEQHSCVTEENANMNSNDEEYMPVIHRLHLNQPRWGNSRRFTFPDHECNFQISPPEPLFSPREYFNKFIGENIIINFVEQTNLYSVQQTDKNVNTNVAEIEQYIGIHLMSSVVKMLSYRLLG